MAFEKAWTDPPRLSLLHVVLLCSIILAKLCGIVWLRSSTNEISVARSNEYNYVGQDYPQKWPINPPHPIRMSLEETTHYQLESTPQSDAEWEALYPENGIIHLGDPSRPQDFSISMFHQLRCIDVLRKEVVLGATRSNSSGTAAPSQLSQHCINYLRQMALCRSDLYISDVFAAPKPKPHPDTYECRDWEEVYEAVGRNQENYRSYNM